MICGRRSGLPCAWSGRGPGLLVPVRTSSTCAALVTVRQPDGTRVGIAFTSMRALRGTLGAGHDHACMAEPALRSMLKDIGVTRLHVDPTGIARIPVPGSPHWITR